MTRKNYSKLVLALLVFGFALVVTPAAFAAETDAAGAAAAASDFGKMGGAIGAGLAVIGAGLGIGRIGGLHVAPVLIGCDRDSGLVLGVTGLKFF